MRWKLLAAPVISLITVLAAGTAGATPQHVPWGPVENVGGILPHAVDFRGTPPGANDWNCRPTPEHPEPVVLLSGTSAGPAQNFRWLAPLLANNGYCVYALTYGIDPSSLSGMLGGLSLPGNADMRRVAAEELAPFVDRVLAATGAERVDFLGHSQGTVLPRWYVRFLGGAAKVAKSVNLTPLWNGSTLYGLSHLVRGLDDLGAGPAVEGVVGLFSHAVLDFVTGSDFLNAVNAGDAFPDSIDYTSIMTRYDEAVVPYTSGFAPPGPNITNVVLQDLCPLNFSEHLFVAADPVVGQLVLNALDPEHATPVDCQGLPRNSG
ncbi:lipase [Nocardia sp. NPDC050712]|uniref:esterase/lipase family protein n=1 Tax=Nocardia sp. NPDC050712 TaxID=3155518 RepID=UPI0033FE77D5